MKSIKERIEALRLRFTTPASAEEKPLSPEQCSKKEKEIYLLGEAFLVNELAGHIDKAYGLSLARTTRSGVSFGICQWDIIHNKEGEALLRKHIPSHIMDLLMQVRGNPSSPFQNPFEHLRVDAGLYTAVQTAHSIISTTPAVLADIRAADRRRLTALVDQVYALFPEGHNTPTGAVVHLADMANQFGPFKKKGSTLAWYRKEGWSSWGFLQFKLQTKHGKGFPKDVERRWRNIEQILDKDNCTKE